MSKFFDAHPFKEMEPNFPLSEHKMGWLSESLLTNSTFQKCHLTSEARSEKEQPTLGPLSLNSSYRGKSATTSWGQDPQESLTAARVEEAVASHQEPGLPARQTDDPIREAPSTCRQAFRGLLSPSQNRPPEPLPASCPQNPGENK